MLEKRRRKARKTRKKIRKRKRIRRTRKIRKRVKKRVMRANQKATPDQIEDPVEAAGEADRVHLTLMRTQGGGCSHLRLNRTELKAPITSKVATLQRRVIQVRLLTRVDPGQDLQSMVVIKIEEKTEEERIDVTADQGQIPEKD